jgi:hypothetical protein
MEKQVGIGTILRLSKQPLSLTECTGRIQWRKGRPLKLGRMDKYHI